MCRSNKVHSNRIPTHKFSSLSSEEVRSLSVRSVLSLDARCNLCGGKEAEEETGTTRSRCFFYFFVEVRNSDIQHFHLHTARGAAGGPDDRQGQGGGERPGDGAMCLSS